MGDNKTSLISREQLGKIMTKGEAMMLIDMNEGDLSKHKYFGGNQHSEELQQLLEFYADLLETPHGLPQRNRDHQIQLPKSLL